MAFLDIVKDIEFDTGYERDHHHARRNVYDRGLDKRRATTRQNPRATGYAGLRKAIEQGLVERDEQIVVLVSGKGLKDIRSVVLAAGKAPVIDPKPEAVLRI